MNDEVKIARRLMSAGSGRVHLVGGCGLGMAGLAFHLKSRGFRVSACDAACGRTASWLEQHGVTVECGHDPSHLRHADWLVRSSAVCDGIPEIAAALDSGLTVLRRGAVLAALLMDYRSVIVSGSHGKTTTAAMIVQMLRACGMPPSFCVGGESDALGGVAGAGDSGIMVAEADESDGTLRCYAPDIAVILNIEFDHAETFDGLDALALCYEGMARQVRERIIYCADDPAARRLCAGMKNAFCYGFDPSSDLRACDYDAVGRASGFTVSLLGRRLGEASLPAAGRHNVLNSLAACAVGLSMNARFSDVREGLGAFRPVRRRFEAVVDTDDAVVISDYAHHPSEVSALMAGAAALARARLLVIFQPHRFTRTRALGRDFPAAFEGADEVILLPVYAASERRLAGGSSWDLYAHFREAGRVPVVCARSPAQAWHYARGEFRPGDALLIVGAGDVVRIAGWAEAAHSRGCLFAGEKPARWKEELEDLGLVATSVSLREPMSARTTLHVGGKADIFAEVDCEADLVRILVWAAGRNLPARVMGAGSNVLVSDLGFRGIILRLGGGGFGSIREDGGCVVAGAAVRLNELVGWLAERGKAGLSFLGGIPGTVGGALRMNAGAWGSAIGARTQWIRVLNRDGSIEKLEKEDLRFAYRQCVSLRGRVVLDAGFVVEGGDAAGVARHLASIAGKRKWMRGLRSAGSVFRNPERESAWRLIEQAGCRGRRVGGARISELHANHIVTETGATASDVNALIEIVRNEVADRSGVLLAREIVCLE